MVNAHRKQQDKIKKIHTKNLKTKTDIWENKKEMVEIVSKTIEKNKKIRKLETDIKEIKKILNEQKRREEIKKNIKNTSFIFKK